MWMKPKWPKRRDMPGGTDGIKARIKDRVRELRSFALLAPAILLCRPVRPQNLRQRLAALPSRGLALDEAVTIRWNDRRMPWIEAKTDRDCAVALGVRHAHLRLAQMEFCAVLRSAGQPKCWALSPAGIPAIKSRNFTRCFADGRQCGQNKVPRIISDLALFDDLRRFADQDPPSRIGS
jgi:hypothetical protein